MKKILITAFEPFGDRDINASGAVLWNLPDRIGEYVVFKKVLPVVFGKAAEDVFAGTSDDLLHGQDADDYAFIFLLGEAGRGTVTPETTARNIRTARILDNEGNAPVDQRISSSGPEYYHTAVPVEEIVGSMKVEGYEIEASHDAGTFVCNDTFYLVGVRSQVPVDFIHVPVAASEAATDTVKRFIELAVKHKER